MHVHRLLVDLTESYPRQDRPWMQIWGKASSEPVDGVLIVFPTGHNSEVLLRDFAKKRLAVHPLPWLVINTPFWTVDVSKLHCDFASYPYFSGNVPKWPNWLEGAIDLSPVFEIVPGVQPKSKTRLSLWITQDAYSAAARRKLGRQERATTNMHFYGEVVMTSQQSTTLNNSQLSFGNNNQVQVGNANVSEDNTIDQGSDSLGGLDLALLASELKKLRSALFNEMAQLDEFVPSKSQSVNSIAEAENAAKRGDGSNAMKNLKLAGKWTLETATKIGTTVAADAIKKALKL